MEDEMFGIYRVIHKSLRNFRTTLYNKIGVEKNIYTLTLHDTHAVTGHNMQP